MTSGALVLFDEQGAHWWATTGRHGGIPELPDPSLQVFCGSLKAWATLEQAGAEAAVHWLGVIDEPSWGDSEQRLADWHRELAAIPPIPSQAPVQDPIRELLSGDLATPALTSLALLPIWAEALAGFSPICFPVGKAFRPPRFARPGDLPLLALAAVLNDRGQEVRVLPVLPRQGEQPTSSGTEGWSHTARPGAVWLTLGKLRHPEWPLVMLEAAGQAVVLFEPEPAAPLPDLFTDATRWRCHPQLGLGALAPYILPLCPVGGAEAPARAWLEQLRHWPPLAEEGAATGRERQRLDRLLEQRLGPVMPALTLVPEENDLVVERLLTMLRRADRPHAVLHHTAEVMPTGQPLRWQRHLRPGDRRLVPLRGQCRDGPPVAWGHSSGAVVNIDPVRAHLLDALELETPLPWPSDPAVGWIHYPLLQQSLLPLADPQSYWCAVDTVREGLAGMAIPLLLARKPPLEPRGLSDARAQGLAGDLPCHPLPALLALSQVVIAPGHLGTAHLEAMARGRAVVLVSPARLRRPGLLLEDAQLPMPRLAPENFLPWWGGQTRDGLEQLGRDQCEWLRRQVTTTMSLGGWLSELGVGREARPQRFLGSGLMVQRPLLERAEEVGRIARRLQAMRSSPPGRLLRAIRALARRG
ncbi:MAG: hypothetical protein VKM17_04645 [Cyanobacteriota bacterium]|nr:hypothetical protein [Cyanobacteriota bacterium]